MRKLRDISLREQTIKEIRDAILSGELKAGDRVSLRDLAARLGISTLPVREAIYVLEQQGLLVRGDTGRVSVAKLTRGDFLRGVRLRALLEGYAVEQALLSLGPTEWDAVCRRLQHVLDSMAVIEPATQGVEGLELDIEWHTLIIDAAQDPLLS